MSDYLIKLKEAQEDRYFEVVRVIGNFTDQHGYSPTVREVAAGLGLASPGSLHEQLARMRKIGWITYEDHKPRTLRCL